MTKTACAPTASITGTAPTQTLNLGLPGLPNGGKAGQVLTKNSANDCDASWKDLAQETIFTARLDNGVLTALPQNQFVAIPLKRVVTNNGGGSWNVATSQYTIPSDGVYLITSTIRLSDSAQPRNLFQAVNTTLTDIPEGTWATNAVAGGSFRFTMPYTRVARFTAGTKLSLYTYSDGQPANITDASLTIMKFSN